VPSFVEPVVPPGCGNTAQPVLRADEGVLRPWDVSDAAAVAAAYADPDIRRWHVRSMTVIEAVEWIRAGQLAWQEERAASWAIELDDAVVGRMTLKLRLSHGLAEAAYWTVPSARGCGIATTALLLATRWAFGLGLQRVELEHSTSNVPSCRVAAKAGFAVEGTRRAAGLHADGWHDMHLHGRVSDVRTVKTSAPLPIPLGQE
jgi:ribosomal-protein-alanine N-acetyltransferase